MYFLAEFYEFEVTAFQNPDVRLGLDLSSHHHHPSTLHPPPVPTPLAFSLPSSCHLQRWPCSVLEPKHARLWPVHQLEGTEVSTSNTRVAQLTSTCGFRGRLLYVSDGPTDHRTGAVLAAMAGGNGQEWRECWPQMAARAHHRVRSVM